MVVAVSATRQCGQRVTTVDLRFASSAHVLRPSGRGRIVRGGGASAGHDDLWRVEGGRPPRSGAWRQAPPPFDSRSVADGRRGAASGGESRPFCDATTAFNRCSRMGPTRVEAAASGSALRLGSLASGCCPCSLRCWRGTRRSSSMFARATRSSTSPTKASTLLCEPARRPAFLGSSASACCRRRGASTRHPSTSRGTARRHVRAILRGIGFSASAPTVANEPVPGGSGPRRPEKEASCPSKSMRRSSSTAAT